MMRSISTAIGIVGVMAFAGAPRPDWGECFPNTVTLEVDGCPEIGSDLSAWAILTNATEEISGGQFFLEYSTAVLDMELADIQSGDPPFTSVIHRTLDRTLGRVGYAVISPGGNGTMNDTVMMRMTFQVVGDQGAPFIRFLDEPGRINKLIAEGGNPVAPHKVNAGTGDTIDLEEMAAFQNCFVGEDGLATPECACLFDHDEDTDVDLADYQALPAMGGPVNWPCGAP